MKAALIFLNGHYDLRYPQFYEGNPDVGGGKQLPTHLRRRWHPLIHRTQPDQWNANFARCSNRRSGFPWRGYEAIPLNSWSGLARTSSASGLDRWTRMTQTDSWQSLMQSRSTAVRGFCSTVGLPHPGGYEIDHFLGNLRLMRLGLQLFQDNSQGDKHSWQARDARPTPNNSLRRFGCNSRAQKRGDSTGITHLRRPQCHRRR